jgi:hypothetical protein
MDGDNYILLGEDVNLFCPSMHLVVAFLRVVSKKIRNTVLE